LGFELKTIKCNQFSLVTAENQFSYTISHTMHELTERTYKLNLKKLPRPDDDDGT